MATKAEVAETLGGYYNKTETEAAIKVQSDAITSSVKSTYATKQQVEDIEIGGRNFMYGNGLVQIHSNNPDLYPITCEETNENNISFYRVKRTDSSLYPNTLSIFNSITKENFNYKEMVGQQVTLSLKARASRDIQASFMNYAYSGSAQTDFGKAAETITTEWKTYFVTIDKFPEIEDGGGVRWLPYMFALADGECDSFYLDLRDWKFEKGNKATDWTPAPEDINKEISTTQNDIKTAKGEITESQTQIEQLANMISSLVTDENGASLMTQTENGWTFSTAEIQSAVDKTTESLDNLVKATGDTESAVEILKKQLSDVETKTDYVEIGTYTYTDESGTDQTEPCIKLGEVEKDSRLLITNTRILFQVGNNEPTRITQEGIVTKNIEVEEEYVHGKFVWKLHGKGNYGLTRRAVT